MAGWIYIDDDYLEMITELSNRVNRIEARFPDESFERARERFTVHVDLISRVWDNINDAPPPTERASCSLEHHEGDTKS